MNISFLNPLFLWGLPLISLPLIIHLLTRKKAILLKFSSIQFIKLSAKHSVRVHKLKQFLLLCLRTLIIFLLIIIFARPLLRIMPLFAKEGELLESLVIIVDNSYSMSCLEKTSTRFQKACDIAKRILSTLEKGDLCALFLVSDHVTPVVGNLTSEANLITEELKNVQLSYYPTDLQPAFQEAYRILAESTSSEKQIILITDLCKNGWKNILSENLGKSIPKAIFDSKIKIIIIDVGEEEKNCGIRGVENDPLEDAIIKEPLDVKIEIHNYSPKSDIKLAPRLSIAKLGSRQPHYNIYDQRLVFLPRLQEIQEIFLCRLDKAGDYIGKIELDEDNLSVDNKFYLGIDGRDKINVLVIDGAPHFSSYKSETFFLKFALTPKGKISPIKNMIITKKQMDEVTLVKYDVVIFANVEEFYDEDFRKVWQFLKSKGNIIFFLGDNIDSKSYNNQLSPILPATLLKPYTGDTQFIDQIDLSHPIFDIFKGEDRGDFSKSSFYSFYKVHLKEDTRPLMALSDGSCLLAERIFPISGMGKVLLFTSSADRDWNNFPTKPLFLPFLQQCIRYLVSEQRERNLFQITVGQYIRLPQTETFLSKEASLTLPDGTLTKIRLTSEEGFSGYSYGPVSHPGLYRLSFTKEDAKRDFYYIANVDASKGESDLRKISKTGLKKELSGVPLIIVSDLEKIEERLKEIIKGKEITYNLAFLLIILLFVEGFAAHRKTS